MILKLYWTAAIGICQVYQLWWADGCIPSSLSETQAQGLPVSWDSHLGLFCCGVRKTKDKAKHLLERGLWQSCSHFLGHNRSHGRAWQWCRDVYSDRSPERCTLICQWRRKRETVIGNNVISLNGVTNWETFSVVVMAFSEGPKVRWWWWLKTSLPT